MKKLFLSLVVGLAMLVALAASVSGASYFEQLTPARETKITVRMSNPTIDGVISPGEYDEYTGGYTEWYIGEYAPEYFDKGAEMASSAMWYFSWDGEYLYIAATWDAGPGANQTYAAGDYYGDYALEGTDDFIDAAQFMFFGPAMEIASGEASPVNADRSRLYYAISENSDGSYLTGTYSGQKGQTQSYTPVGGVDFDFSYNGTVVTAEYRVPVIELKKGFSKGDTGVYFKASVSLQAGVAPMEDRKAEVREYGWGVRLGQFGYAFDDRNDDRGHATFLLTAEKIPEEEIPEANQSGVCGDDAYWTYVPSEKTLYITGSGKIWGIDDEVTGPAPWDEYLDNISRIVIADGITEIGKHAFFHMEATEITLPDSLVRIGGWAFAGNKSLSEINIPDSVLYIDDGAFSGCNNISSINIGNHVTAIGVYAFQSCSLETIYLPWTLKSISGHAFRMCYELRTVYYSGSASDWASIDIINNDNDYLLNADIVFDYTTGHTEVIDPAVAPTCTAAGLTEGKHCSCGEVITAQTELPALGHDFADEWTVDIEATTESEGKKSRHCSRCDEVTDEITIGVVVVIIDSSETFGDVKADSWAKAGIDYVVSYGYMNGTSADNFSPTGTMTRAMIVSVLWRIAGSPEPSSDNPFADLEENQTWYHKAVVWAYENGIVTGTGKTTFAPTGAVTREQMAAFQYRFAKYYEYDTTATTDITAFPDAGSVGSWAQEALAWANANGLITGAKGNDGIIRLVPQGEATREQVATILMRFCEKF